MKSTFRTIVKVEKFPFDVSHQDGIVSMGSCFSENIGWLFQQSKFKININPFGQQYNPISIANALERLVSAELYQDFDLIQHNGLYHSFMHHGSFSGEDKEAVLGTMNAELLQASGDLKKASVLFVTFGTAHYFKWNENGQVVSNCHKIPNNLFSQHLATPDEIVSAFEAVWLKIKAINPDLRVVFTVSPVRYFAFGHYENSVSKAHLFTAIYALQKKYEEMFSYFPAYEIVLDDLRDYRFYKEDMLHPTHQAIQYVWEALVVAIFSETTLQLMMEIDEIQTAAKHRPRNADTEAHKIFQKKYLAKIDFLQEKYKLDFAEEKGLLS